jgi:hypothetical protein
MIVGWKMEFKSREYTPCRKGIKMVIKSMRPSLGPISKAARENESKKGLSDLVKKTESTKVSFRMINTHNSTLYRHINAEIQLQSHLKGRTDPQRNSSNSSL